jgi:hypothetical protein
MKLLDQLLTDIASDHLGISTLKPRNSDSLDFHEVAVWQIKTALETAYRAGEVALKDSKARSLVTRFDGYEIHGVSEFDDEGGKYCEQVPDDEAMFWSLYGHIPGAGLECIGDFKTRALAEEVYERITGERYAPG